MRFRKGYKYQLVADEFILIDFYKPKDKIETEFIDLHPNGNLRIKRGYAWDGCSGPTIDTKTNYRAGLVHDALYQLMRAEKIPQGYRGKIDDLLRDICIEDGMWKVRAKYFHIGVDTFAKFASEPRNKKKIYTAP